MGSNPKMFTGSFYDTCIRYVQCITRFDYRDRLGEIGCPTMIIHGAMDLSVSVTAALSAHKAIPNSKLRIIPLSGHSPNVEQPALVNHIVEKFLRFTFS